MRTSVFTRALRVCALMLILVLFVGTLSSCGVLNTLLGKIEDINNQTTVGGGDPDKDPDTPDDPNENPDKPVQVPTYTAFTIKEKALFEQYIGVVIPFLPNDAYVVEGYYEEADYENGLYFGTHGVTEADFAAYRTQFHDYVPAPSYTDEDGDTWYCFVKDGDVVVEMCYYVDENTPYVDVLVYSKTLSTGRDDGEETPDEHLYTDFNASEKALFEQYIGAVIPFLPNDDYSVEGYYEETDYENGMYFGTVGNTEEEFEAYLTLFSDYVAGQPSTDEYGDTWYQFVKDDDVVVDMVYYAYEGENYLEVFVYSLTLSRDPDDGSGDVGGGEGGDDLPTDHLYTDFTDAEKALFEQYIGTVIPFLPNDTYSVEGYYEETDYENGMYFGTTGNTEDEFFAYILLFDGYVLEKTYEDDYGDTWYRLVKDNDVVAELCYYEWGGEYCMDLFVYSLTLSRDPDDGSGDVGGDEGDGSLDAPDDVLSNEGAGLPEGTNGIYDVDLKDAAYVKDVSDRMNYLGGCPTTGSPAVLVIPVEFSDVTAQSKNYTLDRLHTLFCGGTGTTDYRSLYDYYYTSSYGQLAPDITIADAWFRPQYDSSYYQNATMDYYGDTIPCGDQLILDEALAYLATVMDLSDFDSDGNGIIDAVILVTTLDIDADTDFYWAYRYWNVYTDDEGYYYEYDGVSANDYVWLSYAFMFETTDAWGEVSYDDYDAINPYTFIHEFGHVLGAEDYYDTAGVTEPMGGYDVMDSMEGDHSPFTKFDYGWITDSRLVVTDTSVTLGLTSFTDTGDTVILANNWDPTLGAYQEYYVVIYYRATGLNGDGFGYFDRDCILVYHVNATLGVYETDGETYYELCNNNTHASDPYGTENNLVELVENGYSGYGFGVGDSLTGVETDGGDALAYTFTVDAITEEEATLTFAFVG